MSEAFRQQLALLPAYLGAHLTISLVGLAVGITLSLPLAVFVAKREPLRWPVLAVVGAIQTIPSLALLALMVPLLDAFGFAPAVAALSLYSMLPVLRNTVTGITGVDPGVVEAARGVGMTETQLLWRVELPLAAPMIVAGIRTAAVWVVGIATLSTPIGQTSLGNYIFAGLQTRRWDVVILGCVAATAVALIIDGLIALSERGLRRQQRPLVVAAVSCLAALFAMGVLAPKGRIGATIAAQSPTQQQRDPSSTVREGEGERARAPGAPGAPAAGAAGAAGRRVRVGAKTFTEQYILAALLTSRLQASGHAVERLAGLGSTIAFDALQSGKIDVYVDYTGTLWANHLRRKDTPDPWKVEPLVAAYLAEHHGIRLLCPLGFENAYALAMRRARAEAQGIRTITDLAKLAPDLAIGSDYEFFSRPEWAKLRTTYGLRFRELRSFDSSFMYDALVRDEVDVITAFSSDGRIQAFDLAVLSDPRGAFPPYDAVLLLSPEAAARPALARALTPLCHAIPVTLMRSANAMVDRDQDKRTPAEAAGWLEREIRGARVGGR